MKTNFRLHLIIFSLFTLSACQRISVGDHEIEISGDTTIASNYYKSGALLKRSYKLDGESVKNFREFYENGNIMVYIPYKDGQIDGLKKHYFEDGKLERQIMYQNGVKNGIFQEYYSSGKIKYIGNVDTTFLFTGDYFEYHDNGQTKLELEIMDDINVRYKAFDENGNLKRSAIFQQENEFISIQTSSDTIDLNKDYSIYIDVTDELLHKNAIIKLGKLDTSDKLIAEHGSIVIKDKHTTIMRPASEVGVKYTEGIITGDDIEYPFRIKVIIQ